MRKHSLNVVLLGLAVFVFTLGAWQLDLMVSPLVWGQPNFMREVLPWLYLPNQTFYVLCYAAMFLSIPLTFVALWFWEQ